MPTKHIDITGGDPRRPDAEKEYVRPKLAEDEQLPDYISVVGMFAGMASVLLKVRATRPLVFSYVTFRFLSAMLAPLSVLDLSQVIQA